MKKIAIITYYYKSLNYGGNLQAYALCKALNGIGGNVEQLCFDAQKTSMKSKPILHQIRHILRKTKNIFWGCTKKSSFNRKIFSQRQKAFYHFNSNLTPHSETIYTQDTIKNCGDKYDIFITGSDQVWNPNWYVSAYFLSFVPSGKKKVSYATSFGVSNFSETEKKIIQKHLSDFSLISLREHSQLEGENVFPFKPEVLLDPTLLLSEEEWSLVCGENPIKESYVFCYFFGESRENRELARKYAQKHKCKIASIPHLNGYNAEDSGFADIEFIDASPEMFLTLIKNAYCVFTDSFHAVVFSNIFRKEYYVFKRSESDTMSSRIDSITKLFHSEERFCQAAERMSMEYIGSLAPLDYASENNDLLALKEKSYSFLNEVLNLA